MQGRAGNLALAGTGQLVGESFTLTDMNLLPVRWYMKGLLHQTARQRRARAWPLGLVLALLGVFEPALPQHVTARASREPDPSHTAWPTHGRTDSEQRYSPLTAIDRRNVGRLALAWYLDLDTARGQEATPLLIDGVLYFSTAWSKVYAVDARTGRTRWRFDPRIPRRIQAQVCCDVVNRGVAAWQDRIFVGALDGRLIALDAATGRELWSVATTPPDAPYSITGAPRVIGNKVVIGNSGADLGVRGYVSAYEAATGKLAWRFYTVPGNPAEGFENDAMNMAAATWSGEWWRFGGGGTVWDAMAYDPQLDLLYIGVGNGSPWNHRIRSQGRGDNLFLSSIVALRPQTGEYVWHFQTTPGETWDYTATQHIVLADLVIAGRTRRVLMQAPKNGFFYVLDRATGEFISGRNYVPVNWATGLDPRTGRPLEVPAARYRHRPFVVTPGPSGGHNWYPMSFDPVRGLVFIPVQEMPSVYGDDRRFAPQPRGWNTGTDPLPLDVPDDAATRTLLDTPPRGALLAWDPRAQQPAWRVEHPGVANGGTLATAGGLVFQGTSDGRFNAFASDSGERLWSYEVQDAILGGPITYELDGEQYVAALAGLGGTTALVSGYLFADQPRAPNGRLLVFKLDGEASLPPTPAPTRRAPPDVSQVRVRGNVLTGIRRYNQYCIMCHGRGAQSGPLMPDLRHSEAILEADAFGAIVLEGRLEAAGMAGFADVLSRADAEAIRAYLVWEAGNLAAERRRRGE